MFHSACLPWTTKRRERLQSNFMGVFASQNEKEEKKKSERCHLQHKENPGCPPVCDGCGCCCCFSIGASNRSLAFNVVFRRRWCKQKKKKKPGTSSATTLRDKTEQKVHTRPNKYGTQSKRMAIQHSNPKLYRTKFFRFVFVSHQIVFVHSVVWILWILCLLTLNAIEENTENCYTDCIFSFVLTLRDFEW